VSRTFLIFAVALVALMAGALLYAVKLPLQQADADSSRAAREIPSPASPEMVSHPSFVLPDPGGVEHDFSEWAGQKRILNFWATWCAPCRREIPLLKAFQDERGDDGFQVIGIAVDFADAVIEYAEAAEFNYPILVGEQDAMAVAESSGVAFVGLPFTMFVASDGELLGAYIGELHRQHLDVVADVMTRLDRAELSKDEARAALDRL